MSSHWSGGHSQVWPPTRRSLSSSTRTFPLTIHSTGRSCKKSKGVTYYSGKVSDGWEKAIENFERFWPFDSTGRARPVDAASGALCDESLGLLSLTVLLDDLTGLIQPAIDVLLTQGLKDLG